MKHSSNTWSGKNISNSKSHSKIHSLKSLNLSMIWQIDNSNQILRSRLKKRNQLDKPQQKGEVRKVATKRKKAIKVMTVENKITANYQTFVKTFLGIRKPHEDRLPTQVLRWYLSKSLSRLQEKYQQEVLCQWFHLWKTK